jgi:hypothetical protein
MRAVTSIAAGRNSANFRRMPKIIVTGEETRFAVVAALDDVLRNAGKNEAGLTSHGRVLRVSRVVTIPALRRHRFGLSVLKGPRNFCSDRDGRALS